MSSFTLQQRHQVQDAISCMGFDWIAYVLNTPEYLPKGIGSTMELPWDQTKSCRQNNQHLQVDYQHAPCGRLCPHSKETVLIITHYFPPAPKFPFLYASISSSISKLVHFCPQLQIQNLLFQLWLQCCQTWVFPCPKDSVRGPVAQWTRHLTTNQGIAGSSPARIKLFFCKGIWRFETPLLRLWQHKKLQFFFPLHLVLILSTLKS